MSRLHSLALLGWLAALGCATPPVGFEELPEEPIALVHRTLAQGRERADTLMKMKGQDPAGPGTPGVARLSKVDDFIDRLRGETRALKPELQGRIALFHPRTREIEVLDAFVTGALPCDWSADHQRLMVVSRHRGTAQLYEYSRARGDVARLLRGHQDRLRGVYGPDGRIAYVAIQRAADGIHLVVAATDRDGRGRGLTRGPRDQAVQWTPDGRRLLFQSSLRNGQPVIKSLDLEDEAAEPRIIGRGKSPVISPRGDWVVYVRERDEGGRLWRMRPDGTGKSALGVQHQGTADEQLPAISPDGRYVAYVAEEGERQRIRIRRMDGSGDRLLLDDADGTQPVW